MCVSEARTVATRPSASRRPAPGTKKPRGRTGASSRRRSPGSGMSHATICRCDEGSPAIVTRVTNLAESQMLRVLRLHRRATATRERSHVRHLRRVTVVLEHDLAATGRADEIFAVAHLENCGSARLSLLVHLDLLGPGVRRSPASRKLALPSLPHSVASRQSACTSIAEHTTPGRCGGRWVVGDTGFEPVTFRM